MINTVGMKHPIFNSRVENLPVSRWPAHELFVNLVRETANSGLNTLSATQVGIDQRWFVAALDDEHWAIYINPEIEEEGDEYFYRPETTPNGSGVFITKRPLKLTLSWFDLQGKEHTETFIKDDAADIHSAVGYLDQAPPWCYEKLEEF